MTHEEIPQSRTDAGRGRAVEHGDFLKNQEEKVAKLSARYEEVERRLMTLRNNLSSGMNHAVEANEESSDAIALSERSKIMQEIESLTIEEDSLERELRGLGINIPSATVQ
jgi:predicted  nucleic acid-binding Zn-ribbon protein